jgi:NitT/TauT family transport system ATP-binding protein
MPASTERLEPGDPTGGPFHVVFDDVSKFFDARRSSRHRVEAVCDVSFGIKRGEIVSLIGPSGCGKSTLLAMASGLSRPSAGRVTIDGEEITRPRRDIAFMLQKDLLLPWRTLTTNVELGPEIRGTPAATRRKRALDLLRQCKLDRFAACRPHEASGGMRQRAALARTLAVEPQLLLLDEPFSALDAQTKVLLHGDLATMLAAHQRTTLLITHDITEALALSDRVLVMSHRPGTIIHEIEVDLPHRGEPFQRSLHPGIGAYVAQIWQLLRVHEDPGHI